MIGAPSRFRSIRKAAVLARMLTHFDFSIEENVELLKLQKAVSLPMSL